MTVLGAMTPIRPSIINRQLKAASSKNVQNIDKEFKEQLKDLYKKQDLYEHKKEHVRKYVSPKREDILHRQLEMKLAMEDQLNQKSTDIEMEKQEEMNKAHHDEYVNKYSGPHSLDATTERMKERRDYLKGLMEENKQSECMKKIQQQQEKATEIEADHIRAITPSSWNRRHYL